VAANNSSVRFQNIAHDIAIIALSVVLAAVLANSDAVQNFLGISREMGHFGSFVAGMFFTSIFTTAPAIVALGEISTHQGVVETALYAALGAVIADMLIFRFVKTHVTNHLSELLKHQTGRRRFAHILKFRFFRYLTFFIGGLIIASPLPDELGIALLGMSKMREVYFVPLSFAFNFAGVVAIGLIATNA
jgi:hypothetical protein